MASPIPIAVPPAQPPGSGCSGPHGRVVARSGPARAPTNGWGRRGRHGTLCGVDGSTAEMCSTARRRDRSWANVGYAGNEALQAESYLIHDAHDVGHHMMDASRGLAALSATPAAEGRVVQVNVSDGGVPKRPVERAAITAQAPIGRAPRGKVAYARWMRRSVLAALVDVVAVVLFVAIGRASHHHSDTVGGFLSTLWPFAAGVGVGWVVSSRRSLWRLRAGITVCGVTVAVGMALRVVAGQGTALAFVVVALTFLGAVMLFGRVMAVRLIHPSVDRAPVTGIAPDRQVRRVRE